jgi:hypothetical protein
MVIVAYLSRNPRLLDDISANDVIQWTEDKTLKEYILEMRKTSVWGGSIEIKAFCDLYGMRVIVHIKNTRRMVTFESESRKNGTIHIHWNGGHYIPLRHVKNINDILVKNKRG